MNSSALSRRRFVGQLSVAAGCALLARSGLAATAIPPTKKLGVALVGLGSYAALLASALRQTRFCRLAGVVSGTLSKLSRWAREFDLPANSLYNYETMDRIADNPAIDVIYIVTPPGTHRAFVERAAKTGRHVMCEKPMATSVADCDAMIAACRAAKVQLAIGYRLQFEPHHREMARLARVGELGPFTRMRGGNGFRLGARTWRVNRALAGGGPLMDMGIYVVQAACTAQLEATPVAVTAEFLPVTRPELFNEVEEALRWKMEFSDGAVAECTSSFAENVSRFRAESSAGWLEIPYPAFFYGGQQLETSRGRSHFVTGNQQAAQLDAIAGAFLEGRPNSVPGEMGRRDLAIIEAIYSAAQSGKRVEIPSV
ncbi:MAG: Glucose--fructose oxidoreductase [Verrucomicrobia bacterium]|nr:Glucose--fructose oxidoreductase [Verrucomicrobiota bacterium]